MGTDQIPAFFVRDCPIPFMRTLSHIYQTVSCGFFKGKLTCTNLVEFTQFVSNDLNCRQQVDVMSSDLSKAFDTVDHCILLNKLSLFGLCDSLVLLFKSILVGQRQFVEYQGYRSYEHDQAFVKDLI